MTVAFGSAQTSLAILLWLLSSARRFHSQNQRSLDVFLFCFTDYSVVPGAQQFLKYSNQPPTTIAPWTMPWSQLLWSHFSPILLFEVDVRFNFSTWSSFCSCHTIGYLHIMSRGTGVPVKVASENSIFLTFASFSLRCLDAALALRRSRPLIRWDESAATL